MKDFTFKMPTKIIYGIGKSRDLSEIIASFNAKKVFIVTGKHVSSTEAFSKIIAGLESAHIAYDVFKDTITDPTIESIDDAADTLRESKSQLVIAVGGGSPIDTAKAICMLQTNSGSIREYLFGGTKAVTNRPLPMICIPTTAGSGSEVTAASVITDVDNNIKLSVTHEFLIPSVAIIDPLMHVDMPPIITASTGLDAMTHAIEAYTSKNSSMLSDIAALKAIELITNNIRTATYDPYNLEARKNMAIGSILAAISFSNGGLGAVHGITQSMGGLCHVSHGIANAMMLPYVCKKNFKGNLEKFATIYDILDNSNKPTLSTREKAQGVSELLHDLVCDLPIPNKLCEVNVTREIFPQIVEGTMSYRLLPFNPVVLTEQDILEILEDAYE